MKAIVSAILAFSATSAFSASEANLFVCKGKNSSATMTTSSYTGLPTLSISGDRLVSTTANLVLVEKIDANVGLQVSGFFEGIADASIAYTLIVPHVLLNNAKTQKVDGMLIRTLSGGMMAPNANFPRALEHNTFEKVKCDAQAVKF